MIYMDSLTFKQFSMKFSDYVYENYFKMIPRNDWSIQSVHHYHNRFQFGYKPNVPWYQMHEKTPHKILFQIDYDFSRNTIELHISRSTTPESTIADTVIRDFKDYLHKEHVQCFLKTGRGTKLSNLVPIGDKAKNVLEIAKLIPSEYFNHYSYYRMNFNKHLDYDLHFDLENEVVQICCENTLIHKVKNKKDFDLFLERINSEIESMKVIEKEIIESIEKYDVTCYYNHGDFYIFNERVSFYLNKAFINGKERYRAKFGKNYNINLKLDKLADIIRTKANTYINKKRVKAVMDGSSRDVFKKFMFKIHRRHVDNFYYRYEADSSMNYDEINSFLMPFINEASAIKLSNEYRQYFQMYLRTVKKNNRIDSAFLFGELYVFISPSKHFFIRKDEFEKYDLTTHKWRKSEDKELVEKLGEFIKNDTIAPI